MTGGAMRCEADIRAAGRAAVQRWRDNGWELPEHRAELAAATLAPARDLLAPRKADAA